MSGPGNNPSLLAASGSGPGCGRVLATDTPQRFDAAVAEAVALLRAGLVVVLPTETVYGLAANALDPRAVGRIYEIKGRPAHNPIIVHVSGLAMARRCTRDWPEAAARLAEAFWPGPLTVVVKRAPIVPDVVTAGGATVGLRWPSHPFIQAVIRGCDFPLAAPSANPSNQLSPTNAAHVFRSLGDRVPLIVDGGQSQVGIESTVVDVTTEPPRVLRPGMVGSESIWAALARGTDAARLGGLGGLGGDADEGMTGLRSPGMLPRHYSPRAALIILSWRDTEDLVRQLRARSGDEREPGACHVVAHSVIPAAGPFGSVRVIPHDPEAYARALYAELHRCDEDGARVIVMEAVPEAAEWWAIADRLRRAAAPR